MTTNTDAWLPEVVACDDARTCSKLGGTPWLVAGERWPVCPLCAQPFVFVAQLARDDVPEPMRWAFREDLLQVFLCDGVGTADDPTWVCPQDDPRTHCVRHVRMTGAPEELTRALPPELLDVRLQARAARLAAFLREHGRESDAQRMEIAAEKPVDPKVYAVPESFEAWGFGAAFLFPVQRVTSWSAVRETEPPFGIDKLGGAPRWTAGAAIPTCGACQTPMAFVLQLVSDGLVPVGILSNGTGLVFGCRTCTESTLVAQPGEMAR